MLIPHVTQMHKMNYTSDIHARTLVSRSQTILGEGLVDLHHIVRSGSLDIREQEVMTFAHT